MTALGLSPGRYRCDLGRAAGVARSAGERRRRHQNRYVRRRDRGAGTVHLRGHESRRIVYSVVGDGPGPAHDNASMQVFADGNESGRLVWIHDVLPDELAPSIEAAVSQGLTVIEETLAGRR